MEEENETNTLEEVVKALKQREVELRKEFEKSIEVRFEDWGYNFKSVVLTAAVYCN